MVHSALGRQFDEWQPQRSAHSLCPRKRQERVGRAGRGQKGQKGEGKLDQRHAPLMAQQSGVFCDMDQAFWKRAPSDTVRWHRVRLAPVGWLPLDQRRGKA